MANSNWLRTGQMPKDRCKLFRKRKGTLGQKFFSSRVVTLWNELDDCTFQWMMAQLLRESNQSWDIKHSMVICTCSTEMGLTIGASVPLKSMMHIAYSPYFHNIFKFPLFSFN